MFEEACLKTRRTILLSPTRSLILLLMSAALGLPAMAQGRMGVETSEGLFTVMASINACGYDADMGQSLPLRARVRDEVLKAAQTPEAQTALRNLCNFYDDHLQDTAARTLSNYVSLGLNLADGPQVELRRRKPTCSGRHLCAGRGAAAAEAEPGGRTWTRYGRNIAQTTRRWWPNCTNRSTTR